MITWKTCKSGKETCEWLNAHPNIIVIGMTEDRCWTTIYYKEHEQTSCDPGFLVPPDNNVRPLQSTSPIPPGTVPQPQTLC